VITAYRDAPAIRPSLEALCRALRAAGLRYAPGLVEAHEAEDVVHVTMR
jgi:hypothetical protein